MRRTIVAAAFAAFIVAVVTPAVAAAEKLWVSPSPTVTGNGKSCTEPGFNAIQGAITKAGSGATIEVCSGTYTEQLTVTKSVNLKAAGTPVVKLPAAPASSTTTCASALTSGEPPSTEAAQNEVEICGKVTVKIAGLAIEAAWPTGTCNDDLYGIFAGGESTVTISNSSVLAAGAQPINGCQGGIGIEIGTTRTSPAQTAKATLTNVLVQGYQKNGINVIGTGSTASLKKVTVKGAGLTNAIAQNGLEIARGGVATVNSSSFLNNSYEGNAAATGMIVLEVSSASTVNKSTFENDDLGIAYLKAKTTPLTATSSKFIGSTYEGVYDEEGEVILNKDLFNGGEHGIGLEQNSKETSGPKGSGSKDTIENMSSYAVIGYSDNEAGDPHGLFKISNSKISNNPLGASVQHSVFSESNTLEIVTEMDT